MKGNSGFTIVEILVVVGLIGILTTISSFGYVNYAKRSRDSRRRIDLQQVRSALELYKSNTPEGVYPTTAQYGSGTSSVLVTMNLLQMIPLDPRNNAYIYTPQPAGCNNTTTYCIGYTISTTLEVTGAYTVTPNSIN